MAIKVVVSDPKTGKSYQIETESKDFLGKKMNEKVLGDALGLPGYELEVTGGSDKIGSPMRKDVKGATTKRILVTGGSGFNSKRKGLRMKKRVHGAKIAADIIQVNTKVVKAGTQPLEKLLAKKEEKPEEKKEEGEAPKEEVKEEKPAEGKKEEKAPAEEVKEEKPAEEKKEEPKEKKEEPAPEEKAPAEEPKEEVEKEEKKEEVSESA